MTNIKRIRRKIKAERRAQVKTWDDILEQKRSFDDYVASMDKKQLLRHVYFMVKYLGDQARLRSNDLLKKEDDPYQSGKDAGAADAYESIVFHLQRPELLIGLDYNKINKAGITPPHWLQ
jgi:hypothetical protein